MPRFRPRHPGAAVRPVTPAAVAELCAQVLAPVHFFAGPAITLRCEHVLAEENTWEVFRGRLLEPAHTRQRRTFEAWNVLIEGKGDQVAELLALKLDAAAGELHVVRGLELYAWEGYDAGDNVILSRERARWTRELIATVRLDRFADLDELEDELACLLFLAVVGLSRLPLASPEAPLPQFTFGELFYCYQPGATAQQGSVQLWQDMPARMLPAATTRRERARLLEAYLRATPATQVPAAAELWLRYADAVELPALLREVFNDISLTPWTDFVEKALAFVAALEERGGLGAAVADFLAQLLIQATRHLTAYDLVTFHHRGANYPDALLLDLVLKAYLALLGRHASLFLAGPEDAQELAYRKRLRRRALRQGYLLRRRYEGHAVPDLPTSPGENSRVLPDSHPRVPDEQLLQPTRRRRLLFADDPLLPLLGTRAKLALQEAFADLTHPEERRELGLGLFIDRPLGMGKHPAEPDATPLLTALAYSRSIAQERLRALAVEVGMAPDGPEVGPHMHSLDLPGLPLSALGEAARPGAVTLADARRAAPDFVFLHTLPGSVRAFLDAFELNRLAERFDLRDILDGDRVLIARSPQGPGVRIHDAQLRPRLELQVPPGTGFVTRAGVELPAAGLVAIQVWQETSTEAIDLCTAPIAVPLRQP